MTPGILELIKDPFISGVHDDHRASNMMLPDGSSSRLLRRTLSISRRTNTPAAFCRNASLRSRGPIRRSCSRRFPPTGAAPQDPYMYIMHQSFSFSFSGGTGITIFPSCFRNYVIQYILELDIPSANQALVAEFKGKYAQLSAQKFSSNVVEKCLEIFDEADQATIILELISVSRFDQLMQERSPTTSSSRPSSCQGFRAPREAEENCASP